MTDASALSGAADIAVIGLAGRFPGARNVSEYWENLRNGVESTTAFTDQELSAAGVDRATLGNPNYVKSGAPLPDMELFDAAFFGFSPRDAAIMDPQHRHFLECAWEALESAGHTSAAFPGSIGVYGGSGMHAYLIYNLLTNPGLVNSVGMFLIRHTGNDKDFLTTRVSYLLDLQGPSVNVQTACSTSLVAIHTACQSLLNGECDLALAGGVTIEVPHRRGYLYHEGEILSPDGHCRAFDANSQGTIFGSGVGVVVLRRLADALADGDCIRAVIKGSAVNNDGSAKAGYLAPSVDGQAKAVTEALAIAEIEADSISYIEAHGTGTPVGDPIEVAALTQAFRGQTDRQRFCGLGSVKTNIGHLDTAAGVASFVKVVLALEHGQLPSTLNFERANPAIDFESSPFYVNDQLAEWQHNGDPRRAAVNSLGVGGTNAFVILEEAPVVVAGSEARPTQLLVLSARSESALDAATANLARHLQQHPDLSLADVAYTLQVGRKAFDHRRVVVCRDVDEAFAALEQRDPKRVVSGVRGSDDPSVVFMFPGGGAQYPNMGRELYETEPLYREQVEACLRLLEPRLAADLKKLIFPPQAELEAAARELEQPSVALPALFITEYALARLLIAWGIRPAAMAGHSMGEYTAACLAGVMSLEDALSLVALRGRLFERLPGGAMLSVRLPHEELRPLLDERLSIAAINAPGLCVASGDVDAIQTLEAALTDRAVEHTRLMISVAAHSAMLAPILDEFRAHVAGLRLKPPTLPYVSNLTGTWITAAEATDPEYWVRHLRNTVRFSDGIEELQKDPSRLYLEVGPGQVLSALLRQHPVRSARQAALPLTRHPREAVSDVRFLLTAVGNAWLAGATVDWSGLHAGDQRRRLPLPTYPFEHQRYWIEPGQQPALAPSTASPLAKLTDLADWFYRPVWRRAPAAAPTAVTEWAQRWLVFKDRRGLGDRLAERLAEAGHQVVTVTPGPEFARSGDAYVLNPDRGADYDALLADLVARDKLPQRVVHLWPVASGRSPGGLTTYDESQALGFYSLLFLAQALGRLAVADPIQLAVVSNGMQAVGDEVAVGPEWATLLGPCRVIPREFPELTCRSIDLRLPVETAAALDDALVGQLLEELSTEPSDPVVALRTDGRWVESFEATRVDEAPTGGGRLREGGVYLITGGTGDLGLVQAEYLARTVRAKLVLVGRTGLPTRESWAAWLETHDEWDAVSRKIRQVQAIEQLGAEVLIPRADVADLEQMRAVIASARERFGAIHGVIHAAGVLDDGLIQLKTPEAAARVLAPKVMGTLVLDALLGGQPLDFFVLFSSTSAILGPVGQVDYVGANAFLNAFAHSKAADRATYTVAIDWGIWRDVGMAARAAGQTNHGTAVEIPAGRPMAHPLLGVCVRDRPDELVYRARYGPVTQWVLDQHRLKSGEAIMPGTGYLEIARAAFAKGLPAQPVELRDVLFVSPLEVAEQQGKEVRISLKRDGAAFTFDIASIASPPNGEAVWQQHARGRVGQVDVLGSDRHCLPEISARCTAREQIFDLPERKTKQEEHVAFGPRWRNLRRIGFGNGEALALLELSEEFSADLADYATHPALLDMATSFALPLIAGYEQAADFYVPSAYKRILFRAPLPRRLYSHARQRALLGQNDVAVFDVTIMDERGEVLAEVEEFTLKRVPASALLAGRRVSAGEDGSSSAGAMQAGERPSIARQGLLGLVDEGILPQEGTEILARVLAGGKLPWVVASSIDLHALIRQTEVGRMEQQPLGPNPSRPAARSGEGAPRDGLEQRLAELWQELLGVERVGIHDDFFELGGYSLIAVRMFARIKKIYGVELSLEMLFQSPTIADWARTLRDQLGPQLRDAGQPPRTAREETAVRWSPLVEIQSNGSNPPFFCVHGAGGNVLNLRDLARQLGSDQPFFGLQAQGVDGTQTPLPRIEDMAALYIRAIREIQPRGPYYLGGYSGGGVIAFEMAQQLRRDGEETALVAFLDTFCPILPQRPGRLGERLLKLRRFGPNALGWLNRRYEEQIARWNRVRILWYTGRHQPVPYDLRELRMFDVFLRAQSAYQPEPYPGRVALFRATQPAPIYDHVDRDLGWLPFAAGGLEIHEIPGGHHNLVLEPGVGLLAARLRRCLELARAAMKRAA